MGVARQTKAQIERAVAGAIAGAEREGLAVGAVEVLPDGRIRIERAAERIATAATPPKDSRTPIPWT